jgi:site-specific recombinase XerD
MDQRGYLPNSRHRKTYAIKSFFTFLHRYEYLPVDIAKQLIPPTPQEHEPRYLTEQEYTRLLNACCTNRRDTAIITLFLQTGMCLSELAGLKLSDIELPTTISPDPNDTGIARIRRKGGTIDTIALNFKACDALAAYLAERPTTGHAAVFISKLDTPLSTRAIQYMIEKYLEAAGIVGASVHKLRHTFATHHVARGTDLKTLQDMLGHASLVSTEVYVSPAKNVQRQALQEHAL